MKGRNGNSLVRFNSTCNVTVWKGSYTCGISECMDFSTEFRETVLLQE